MTALLDGLKALGAARLMALGAVAFAMMGLLTVLALHGPTERMALLYGDLDLREASQIADLLDRQKLAHEIGGNGNQILVAADQVARARLLLAKEGLPTGGSIGYEIFDRGDNLTASQFQQAINQSRALEGELARTIRGINGVKGARVHLVLPKREPFTRDRQDAQASVLLTMAGTGRLDNEGTRAVVNLIAAAVPGLRAQNIAVMDTRGNLLARAGEPTGPAGAAQTNDDTRHAAELRVARAIEEMLERTLGAGRVRAEASIDFDYEQIHETLERYDPDGQVVRSSQNVTNTSKTTEAAATVSVQNNLPNADAGNNQAGTSEQRQEETTNYEIAKTVRTMVRDQPRVARMSLAVMVDGTVDKGPDGAPVWKERSADELERIARLVRSAIGYDDKRGDRVEVVSLRFVAEPDGVTELPPGVLGLEKADLIRLTQSGLLGLLGLLALLLVVRPMVVRLTTTHDRTALALADDAAALRLLEGGGEPTMGAEQALRPRPDGQPLPALTGPAGSVRNGGDIGKLLEDESMINIGNIQGQLKASSIRRIADLVAKHPEESLAIVRTWMQQEAV